MSVWQIGELFLIPCQNDENLTEKYKFVRNLGFKRVHFMVNCSPVQMLNELVSPTKFENPNSDYYCSFGKELEQKLQHTTEDGEVISFVDNQLLCDKEPICESCFLIGQILLKKHCSKHKPSLKRKRECECGNVKQASFNLPGETIGKWCGECPYKSTNAVDVMNKKCGCGHRPSFNLPGETIGRWCDKCPDKPTNAVNVVTKLCVCKKSQPIFNLPGETVPIWCAYCPDKPANAIDVKDKKCLCGKVPIFNLPGETIGKWCNTCLDKPPNAIDVKNKKCPCGKRPNFNLPGEKIGKWCDNCEDKPPNAVDVTHKKCVCGARPNYNLPGLKIPIWCINCKPPNAVDVTHRKCNCGERAYFNIPGQILKYCGQCRMPGMVNEPRKRCISKHCKELALFGIDNQRLHCENHKKNGEFNLVERLCESCGLMEVLDQNNICRTCDPMYFKQYIKRKEYHIKDLLDVNKLKYIHDKISNGTKCGKERPDFVFEFDDHVVILEVDENQHKSYSEECEKIRMFNITQSYGGIPVFWIRYNPDDFKPKNAKRKSNISQLKREKHLIDLLKESFQREMKTLGEVVYLFYNDCKEKTFASNIINIF
jgi:hypothetical protein